MLSNKIAGLFILLIILIGVIFFSAALPYMLVGTSYSQQTKEDELAYLQQAYKFSIYKAQKIYTIEAMLPVFVVMKDYTSAIMYFEELEKLKKVSSNEKALGAYAYQETGFFDKALEHAKESGNNSLSIKIYIKKKDLDSADAMVAEMLEAEKVQPQAYLYKAQIDYARGDYKSAEYYIDKALVYIKGSGEVYRYKSKIAKKLGKTAQAKYYERQMKQVEVKRMKALN